MSGLTAICAGLGGGRFSDDGNFNFRTVMQGVSWTDAFRQLTALCRLAQRSYDGQWFRQVDHTERATLYERLRGARA